MNSIDISKEEYSLLNRYIGQGWFSDPLVFFGNEPGTSGLGVKDTIKHLETCPKSPVSTGFLIGESYAHPTTSDFARYISRLCLGLEHKDKRWFGELSPSGTAAVNDAIMKTQDKRTHTLINLRPLPRPTQDTWEYSNINKKDYLRKWNFMLKGHYSDLEKEERLKIFRCFFAQRTGIVIGVGEKENKKAFFKAIYPPLEFSKADLDTHTIYFNTHYRIILSDYFNNRNGIKLQGLLELYNFITTRKFI